MTKNTWTKKEKERWVCFLTAIVVYCNKTTTTIQLCKLCEFVVCTDKDSSFPASGRKQLLLQKLDSVEAENMELKKQLKVVHKRLQDLYERDNQQGTATVIRGKNLKG